MLKHDDLFKVGEIDFGKPRRMTYEEMKKEFPCHFLVLKDVEYDEFYDVKSGVVVKVSFGDKCICTDFIMNFEYGMYKYYFTSDLLYKYSPDYVANEIYGNYGSDRGGVNV